MNQVTQNIVESSPISFMPISQWKFEKKVPTIPIG